MRDHGERVSPTDVALAGTSRKQECRERGEARDRAAPVDLRADAGAMPAVSGVREIIGVEVRPWVTWDAVKLPVGYSRP